MKYFLINVKKIYKNKLPKKDKNFQLPYITNQKKQKKIRK